MILLIHYPSAHRVKFNNHAYTEIQKEYNIKQCKFSTDVIYGHQSVTSNSIFPNLI